MIVKRLPIDLPGKADGYLTKYLIPEIVKQRLAQVCSPRVEAVGSLRRSQLFQTMIPKTEI